MRGLSEANPKNSCFQGIFRMLDQAYLFVAVGIMHIQNESRVVEHLLYHLFRKES